MFEYNEYLRLLEDNVDSAERYRINSMPKTLYKYISLSDMKNEKEIEMDKNKLNDLENKRLWLSTFNNLNDPFELKGVYIDRGKLGTHNWGDEIPFFEKKLEDYRKMYLIGSLTTHMNDNLPMWAHYTNNHFGICIEYEVKKGLYLYRVSYEPKRQAIATILTQLVQKPNKKTELYSYLLFNTAMMKYKEWEYEDEYRIIYHNKNNKENGESIPLNELEIRVSKIFIGINCRSEYIERLKNISKFIGCELYQMYFNDESENFELSYKKLNID